MYLQFDLKTFQMFDLTLKTYEFCSIAQITIPIDQFNPS